jgi:hypothetical protein
MSNAIALGMAHADFAAMDTEQDVSMQETGEGQSTGSAPAAQSEAAEIVSANLRALESVYFAAILEEARVFEVVDRLVTMFAQGMLPLGPGKAGAMLYKFWKGEHKRLTAAQRRTVYARAFGMASDDPGLRANQEFNDLWMNFVSMVGMYSAELQSLPPSERSVGPDEVLLSGRALAINLSNYGHGLAWFAAPDLKPEVQQVMELLSSAELEIAFSARTPWEVIYNVAASELGATLNVSRAHTRADSGVIIIRWLANRRARLLRPRSANILKHEDIFEGRTAASQNKKATVYPTDADLVIACERWLGVTGTQEVELKQQATLEAPEDHGGSGVVLAR